MSIHCADDIRREVLSWPGVTEVPHRFGGVEFRLGKREIGHLHGDALADLPFPVKVREELVAAGKALPHHVLPDSGWVSLPLHGAERLDGALALFRLSYERATAAWQGRDMPVTAASEMTPITTIIRTGPGRASGASPRPT